ncbi:hypothetical protein [Candidatus Palauibacter sp.]|uniref:hypothetical protein n=1 Tax=Candidatus Palauibacter sp. TaxID=3101350 RepID=UPI003AF251BD
MRRPRRAFTSLILMFGMALPLAGQVEPDACTASCHSHAMDTWNSWYDGMIGQAASESIARGWADTEGARVFRDCMGDQCGVQ